MNETEHETQRRDASFAEPLRRVAYEEGMLLGIEAVRAEQDYHRRRLGRHHHWLHGQGTVAGLAVDAEPDPEPGEEPARLLVTVRPGLAIDGYGREITVPETHGLVLEDWLAGQDRAVLETVHDAGVLRLKVTIHWEPCERGFQPVLARRLNVATDAVAPSRIGDGFAIDLLPDADAERDESVGLATWQKELPALEDLPESALTDADAKRIEDADDATTPRLELRARLLHGFRGGLPGAREDRLLERARVLLARLELQAPTLDTVDLDPDSIAVDNLVRPFVLPANQSSLEAQR